MRKFKYYLSFLLFILVIFLSGCFNGKDTKEIYTDQFGYERDLSKINCDAYIMSTDYFMEYYGSYIGNKGDDKLASDTLLRSNLMGESNLLYLIFCGKTNDLSIKIDSVELLDCSYNLLFDKKAIKFKSGHIENFTINNIKSEVSLNFKTGNNIDEMINLTAKTDISFFAIQVNLEIPEFEYFKIELTVKSGDESKKIIKQFGNNQNNLSNPIFQYDNNEVKNGDVLDITVNQSKILNMSFEFTKKGDYNFKVLVYTFKPNLIETKIDGANTNDTQIINNDDYQLIIFNYSGSSSNGKKEFDIGLDLKENTISESEIRIYFIPSFRNYTYYQFYLKDISNMSEIEADNESIFYDDYSYYKFTNKNITSITIPGFIDKKPVIIAKDAFKDFTNLKSVIIEDGAFGISKGAFSGCTSLESISIPNSIIYIEDYAFEGVNDNVFYKKDYCCYLGNEENKFLVLVKNNNLNIEQFESNPNTSIIAGGAFENNTKLKNVKTLFVKGIGNYAFKNCSSLNEFNGNDYLSFIGEGVFSGCKSLDNLLVPVIGFKNSSKHHFSIGYLFGTIPYEDSYETIAPCIINNETVLQTFYLPYSLTTVKFDGSILPEYTFAGAKFVKNFEITNVDYFYCGAFMDCESMEKFVYSRPCILKSKCFYNCKSLKEIDINSLGTLSDNEMIFEGCPIEKATVKASLVEKIMNPNLSYLCTNYIYDKDVPLLVENCPELSYLEMTDYHEYKDNLFEGIFIDKAKIHFSSLSALKNCVRELEVKGYHETITSYMFINASKLEKLILSPDIIIKEAGLYGCSSLKSLTIGFDKNIVSGLCYIFGRNVTGQFGFEGAKIVKQLENRYVGSGTNYYCPAGLKEIIYIGSYIPSYCFENLKLENLSIPNDIKIDLDEVEVENLYFNGSYDEFCDMYSKYDNINCYILDENGQELYNGKKYKLVKDFL